MFSSTDNIIKLAWSDKVSFEAIKRIHGLSESEVIIIMRKTDSPLLRTAFCIRGLIINE